LVVNYPAGTASPATTIRDYLQAGRTPAGTWTGTGGLRSSVAAADPNNGALGYAEASALFGPAGGTFMGRAVGASAVLVRYTMSGDATLDGRADFNDLVAVAQHYNQSAGANPISWSEGNVNYDDRVDFNDLVSLAQHYNQALSLTAATPAAPAPAVAAPAPAVAAPASIESTLNPQTLVEASPAAPAAGAAPRFSKTAIPTAILKASPKKTQPAQQQSASHTTRPAPAPRGPLVAKLRIRRADAPDQATVKVFSTRKAATKPTSAAPANRLSPKRGADWTKPRH
jgi:hypothetical protein